MLKIKSGTKIVLWTFVFIATSIRVGDGVEGSILPCNGPSTTTPG